MAQRVARPDDPGGVSTAGADKEKASILWFTDVDKDDVAIAGGKGANLGEMTRKGAPVPPGFIVTVASYRRFLDRTGLQETIRDILADLDVTDSQALAALAQRVRQTVVQASMPPDLATEIVAAYQQMGGGPVAVRSSATAEDLADASFAGQQRTFLNVEGADQVVEAVKGCWASLFEARAIFYRQERGFDQLSVSIAVPVQRMVQSEVSGVMFTVEPMTNDRSKILIEAVYGLGEAIVSGEVTPDSYLVDRETLSIVDKRNVPQTWKLVRNDQARNGGTELNVKAPVPPDLVRRHKIDDAALRRLARQGIELEEAYGHPQDIEWAYEGGQFYITQTRAVTTLHEVEELGGLQVDTGDHPILLTGSAASPGAASGRVVIVRDLAQLNRVQQGDILVTEMTTPDFVPAMKRAAAIVTDKGGRTAHAAIISRELGIPCVVGTGSATQRLAEGQVVTVDGSQGRVYAGAVSGVGKASTEDEAGARLKTATNIYVNLAEPELAEVIARRNVDGVGLLRAEFIIAGIGEHPRLMVEEGRSEQFIEKLAEGLEKFAAAFDPRPVVYRATDFKTNEYRNLRGGEQFELVEENPMIGYRGAARYTKEPDLFALEIEAVKRVRARHKNLYVMIPFVRTVEELAHTKALLEQLGLRRGEDEFKLWMMVEVPSNVFLLDEFIDVGIDGISIGSNDLTQLVLGVDRDSATLAAQFDERNPAVMRALEAIVTTAKRRGVTCSICGQAPSFFPDLTARLVEWGITSVSVSPDVINKTREIVHEIESRRGVPAE